MPMAAKFFIAFVVVLALIALAAWLVRRFGANRLGGASARGRQPRLAVIDAASVDGRRRLILIRRDNIEHLLMIGGPTDVVVEQNIVRAAARNSVREPARPSVINEAMPRAVPLGDVGSWPLQPEPAPIAAPMPPPASRSYRPAATEEPWVASEAPAPRSRPESGNGMSANFSAKLGGDFSSPPRPAPQAAPAVTPPLRETPAETSGSSQTDNNLAEMAQRLEAALRRPPMGEPHAPVTDPLGAAFTAPSEAKFDFKSEPKFEQKSKSKFEPKFEPKFETKPAPAKSAYDSLEQEMASLLGRPSGKT